MFQDQKTVRDHGVELISRINRWLIAVAIGLSGVLSLAAASAFKGHPHAQSSQPAAQRQPSGSAVPLGQPAQAPTPAPVGGGAVVSGGS